jgi:hypothetical protein
MTTLYDIDKLKKALQQARIDLVKFGQHDIRCDKISRSSISVKPDLYFKCTCGLDEQIAKLQAVIDET